MLTLLLWSRSALAQVPPAWSTGTWEGDQRLAATWYGLTPHAWGWILAAAAVLGAALVAWRLPRRETPPPLPADLEPAAARRWLAAILLGLLALYAPGFRGSFNRLDDYPMILWNDRTHTLTWDALRETLTTNPRGISQELMLSSFQVNWALAGDAFPGWYAVQLGLVVTVLLLAHALYVRLVGHRGVALLALALLGTRPILAEYLGWMSTRGHLFGMVFALSTLLLYLRYLREGTGRRWAWLLAAAAAFALSQLGKPFYLFVPAWLVLLDLWEGRRDLGRMVLDKLPFALIAVVFLRKILRAGAGRVGLAEVGETPLDTLRMDLDLLLEYGRAVLLPYETGLWVPVNPAPSWIRVEGVPQVLPFGFAPLASLLVIAAAVAVAVLLATRTRWPLLLLGAALLVTSLVTVANFPSHSGVFAYRYTLPGQLVAALVLAAAGLSLHATVERRWLVHGAVGALLVAGVIAFGANRHAWQDSATYWTRNAALYPVQGRSHYFAGRALQHERPEEEHLPLALHHLEAARRLEPANLNVYKRLGDVHHRLGHLEAAREAYAVYFGRRPQAVTRFYRTRLTELGLGALVGAD